MPVLVGGDVVDGDDEGAGEGGLDPSPPPGDAPADGVELRVGEVGRASPGVLDTVWLGEVWKLASNTRLKTVATRMGTARRMSGPQ
ncbi:MAG: hypothetical protein M3066_02450 [Actinomycetota bacterium]|nr:hypothetical protein [Actinomycetota bacterium]